MEWLTSTYIQIAYIVVAIVVFIVPFAVLDILIAVRKMKSESLRQSMALDQIARVLTDMERDAGKSL